MNTDEIATVVTVVALVAILGATIIPAAVQVSARKACLAAGYPTAKIDFTLTAYCVKRVDQTDVVVPLESLRK